MWINLRLGNGAAGWVQSLTYPGWNLRPLSTQNSRNYSKTCLKRNAIVPVFFFRFHMFPFYKGLCFNKTKYKKYDRLGLQ